MNSSLVVGVLALQGAFAKHAEMLRSLGVDVIEVRTPADLSRCDGLVIPGGESTTMIRQIRFIELEEPLKIFSKHKPVFGTCAGMILISKKIIGDSMQSFGFLDIAVERNAFGRQVESFVTPLELKLHKDSSPLTFEGFFIRAPRIREVGPDVEILAEFQGESVFVRQGKHLAASFHPELTSDNAIHTYFLKLIEHEKRAK